MPFYIRKSISAGPFRFNLSKSGLGLSVGIRGLRIGTGPRGHYVHAGRGGLYYRSSIGRAGERRGDSSPVRGLRPETPVSDLYHPTVQMVEVESSDVLQMADSRFQTVLDDLNGRASEMRLAWIGAAAGLIVWALSGFGMVGFVVSLLILGVCTYMDSYRRASVVFYDLEGGAHDAYLELVGAFETLARCDGKWHVAAGGAIRDLETWKRNAGAGHLVNRSATALEFRLPAVMKSNLTPPTVQVGKQWLHFMPDVILVAHDNRFGAVAYEDLAITHQYSRFIEDGAVPRDAQVVDRTWRFVNKKGGPDLRFNDNRQLPICLYEAMHLSSGSGLNELLEFSRTDVGAPFKEAVRRLAQALRDNGEGQRALAAPTIVASGEQGDAPAAAANTLGPPLWQNVRYGMSLAEVRTAQPETRPPAEDSSLGDGARAELELPDQEVAGARGSVLFYFRGEMLAQVALSFGSSASEKVAADLLAALTARYGSPLSRRDVDPEDLLPKMEAEWLLPTGVSLSLLWLRAIALNVNYQFREGVVSQP